MLLDRNQCVGGDSSRRSSGRDYNMRDKKTNVSQTAQITVQVIKRYAYRLFQGRYNHPLNTVHLMASCVLGACAFQLRYVDCNKGHKQKNVSQLQIIILVIKRSVCLSLTHMLLEYDVRIVHVSKGYQFVLCPLQLVSEHQEHILQGEEPTKTSLAQCWLVNLLSA